MAEISDEVMEMLSRLGEEHNACIPHGPVRCSMPTDVTQEVAWGGRSLLVTLRAPEDHLPVLPEVDERIVGKVGMLKTMPWPEDMVWVRPEDVEQELEHRHCIMCNGKMYLLDGSRCDSLNCDDGWTAYREQEVFGWLIRCSVLRRIALLPKAQLGVTAIRRRRAPYVRFMGCWEHGFIAASTRGEVSIHGPF